MGFLPTPIPATGALSLKANFFMRRGTEQIGFRLTKSEEAGPEKSVAFWYVDTGNVLKPKIGSCVTSTTINQTLISLSPYKSSLSWSFYKWVDLIPCYSPLCRLLGL
ncbi:hypothetical protein M9H77_04969 [Catharanthus roseus]|uniref:Uncharacterized protein n=1 Tax=Catharanthus roseus TaxID=4058 RepID=A0ACC0CG56_CATRO|nr:hypothetical protein M9H77_04969 [Catharanthus roseus]